MNNNLFIEKTELLQLSLKNFIQYYLCVKFHLLESFKNLANLANMQFFIYQIHFSLSKLFFIHFPVCIHIEKVHLYAMQDITMTTLKHDYGNNQDA